LLFAIAVVLTLVWLDPALQYQARAPVFYLEGSFLRDFMSRPGGLLAWLATFLLQWYPWSWMAVLIAAALIGLSGGAAFCYFAALSRQRPLHLSVVPLVPLVALQSRYYDPALELSLALALVWLVLAAYTRWPLKRTGGQIIVVWGLAALVYYLTGGFLLLLAALSVIFELRPPRPRWTVAVAWLASAAGLPWIAHPFQSAGGLRAAYLQTLWLRPFPMAAALYAAAVVIALLLLLRSWGHFGAGVRWASRFPTPSWMRLGLVMSLILVVAWTARNPHRQALLLVDYHARRQNWPAVLAQVPNLDLTGIRANQVPAALITAYLDIRRALYYTGRMSDDLFSLPCPSGLPLLPTTGQGFYWCIPASELLLELGHVNYAEHWAHEALEIKGERPETLKILATVNQLLDRPKAARVFLNRLACNPAHAAEARRRLARLEADPRGERDPVLQQLRSVMVKTDHPSAYLDAETLLRDALSANPHNRMAYEYLMAHHLLNLQLDPAIRLMSRSGEVGFACLPRHYEEAWLLRERLRPADPPAVPTLAISQAARERFQDFEEQSHRLRNDRSQLRAALGTDHADTFWFYYLFGETPGRGAGFTDPAGHDTKRDALR
jgi:tetratricopeptide (TPR) repeat protein